MILTSVWRDLEASALGSYIASAEIAFPLIEAIHVVAITTVVGAIAIMDLRLLGFTSRNWTMSSVSRETLPLTWCAFALAVVTGLLLFVSKATTYMANPYFLSKMALIALAGANMAIFHVATWKTVGGWETGTADIPRAARVAAALSLIFWALVVFCGRIIGFTLGAYSLG